MGRNPNAFFGALDRENVSFWRMDHHPNQATPTELRDEDSASEVAFEKWGMAPVEDPVPELSGAANQSNDEIGLRDDSEAEPPFSVVKIVIDRDYTQAP